eukprot:222159-Chlamydomonas_euryale.AAC.1
MLDQMRGVLDLTRAQQVDLNARVDGLAHRMAAALAVPTPGGGGVATGARSPVPRRGGDGGGGGNVGPMTGATP